MTRNEAWLRNACRGGSPDGGIPSVLQDAVVEYTDSEAGVLPCSEMHDDGEVAPEWNESAVNLAAQTGPAPIVNKQSNTRRLRSNENGHLVLKLITPPATPALHRLSSLSLYLVSRAPLLQKHSIETSMSMGDFSRVAENHPSSFGCGTQPCYIVRVFQGVASLSFEVVRCFGQQKLRLTPQVVDREARGVSIESPTFVEDGLRRHRPTTQARPPISDLDASSTTLP